ncbi:MAG TPA: ABC transporter permease [Thermomicrobiales bacterium]|jgi:peptide/nickel transport system permease protein
MGAQPLTRPAGSPPVAGATNLATTALARTSRRRTWRISPVIAVCMAFLLLLTLASIFAPLIAPHDPLRQALSMRNRPPAWISGGSVDHLLGTDNLGYDIFSRLLYGARISLAIGVIATIIGALLGTALGLIAGFFRGPTEWVIMLAVDAQLATPFLVIAIATIAAFGKGLPILIVLAGVSGWMGFARACRSSVLSLRERDFVAAARALGATDWRILAHHILPNLWSIILVIVTIDLRRVILFEASLSFLGLGVQPPQPSWGSMIDKGREYLGTAWWISIFPGLALMLTILAVSLIGDWLRDALDPTLRNG